ncbi:MAG: hypothetical protein EOP84_00290 [Verrucomicrobiaceae bacterium]|nr:MAG: hypothetical protein EOP84_00290 [Verrucomicrobiaceae bacterium]
MKIDKNVRQGAAFACVAVLLAGCTSVTDINRMWGADNDKLRSDVCRKELPLTKRAAVVALVETFGQLNLLVENTDPELGLVRATGKAPAPLSYDEFEQVKKVEGPRIKNPFFSWNMQFDIALSGVVNERAGGGSLTALTGRLDFEGNKQMVEPVSELPPLALKLACEKIFARLEKTASEQQRTLAQ